MKYSDSGDYCVLYLESSDDRNTFFNVIDRQQKQVVIILAEHVRILQRPEDFVALKHMKRQLAVGIVFVIESSEHLAQLASRHGFPVYSSMDALADALLLGHVGRQRALNRTTSSLGSGEHYAVPKRTIPLDTARGSGEHYATPKRTIPLGSLQEGRSIHRTAPLLEAPLGTEQEEREFLKTAPLPGRTPLTDTLPARSAYPEASARPKEPEPPEWAIPLLAEQPRLPAPPSPLVVKQRRSHFS